MPSQVRKEISDRQRNGALDNVINAYTPYKWITHLK